MSLSLQKGWVTTVLTGNCGPNAFKVFGQAGIQVIVGLSGAVRNVVEQFKRGAFSFAPQPNVASHFGMNAPTPNSTPTEQPKAIPLSQGGPMGLGMGRGKGYGGGMRKSMRRGMNMGGGVSMTALDRASGPQNADDYMRFSTKKEDFAQK